MKTTRIVSLLLVFLLALTGFALPVLAAEQAPEQEKEQTDPFRLISDDITALYTSKSGTFMVSPFYQNDEAHDTFAAVISSLTPTEIELDPVDAAVSIEGSFLLVHKDGSRIIYTLNTKGRIQAGGKAYQISEDAYAKLLRLYTEKRAASSYAQWLIYMIPRRVTGITYQTDATGAAVTVADAYMWDTLMKIRAIRVSGGESYRPLRDDLRPGNGTTKISLHFPEEGRYDLWFVGNTLYLETSDLHIGCKYTMDANDVQAILKALKSPEDIFPTQEPQ